MELCRGISAVDSLDDPVLKTVRIGVQLIGDDGSNTPPAHALARRGIVENVRGYSVFGDYSDPALSAGIMAALSVREIDVAIVWGPLAGYFASRSPVKLTSIPVQPETDGEELPMAFDISMGTRKDDSDLAREVESALERRRADIAEVLDEFAAPRLDLSARKAQLRQ